MIIHEHLRELERKQLDRQMNRSETIILYTDN